MELIQLSGLANQIICQAANLYSSFIYIVRDKKKYRRFISKNSELKNKYDGETCYVIGNGPSLKKIDLSVLVGKHVMTVNKAIMTPIFEQLKPEFHCVIDKYILDDTVTAIQDKVKQGTCETRFILHRSGIGRIDNKDNVYFVYNRKFPVKDKINIELTGNATTFYNVLPFAASCAMYMGFKRIVLLGNDFSFFAARKDQHFYDIEQNVERKETLYSDLMGCAIVLLQYRALNKYCQKHNVEIVNATEGSLLDEIKQVNFEDYLDK